MSTYAGYIRVSRVGDRSETLKSPADQEREINRAKRGNTKSSEHVRFVERKA